MIEILEKLKAEYPVLSINDYTDGRKLPSLLGQSPVPAAMYPLIYELLARSWFVGYPFGKDGCRAQSDDNSYHCKRLRDEIYKLNFYGQFTFRFDKLLVLASINDEKPFRYIGDEIEFETRDVIFLVVEDITPADQEAATV